MPPEPTPINQGGRGLVYLGFSGGNTAAMSSFRQKTIEAPES